MRFIEFGRDPLAFIGQPPGWTPEAWRRYEATERKNRTEEVVAAVRRMNQVGKGQRTSVMAAVPPGFAQEIQSLNGLISAINEDIRRHPTVIGTSKIINWGGFLQEWMAFKQRLITLGEGEARPLLQILRERAILWAGEVSAIIKGKPLSAGKVEITFKNLLVGTALLIGGVWICRRFFGDREGEE